MEHDSDSDLAIRQSQEPDGEAKLSDSDSDVAVPLDVGRAGTAQAERRRRLSVAPRSGSCGGWIVGKSTEAADPLFGVGFADFRWHVLGPKGELNASQAAVVDQYGPTARDAWGHVVYEVHKVWGFDELWPLDEDTCTSVSRAQSSAPRDMMVDLEHHAQVGGVSVKDVLRALDGMFLTTVLLLPLTVAVNVFHSALPTTVRVASLGLRILSKNLLQYEFLFCNILNHFDLKFFIIFRRYIKKS